MLRNGLQGRIERIRVISSDVNSRSNQNVSRIIAMITNSFKMSIRPDTDHRIVGTRVSPVQIVPLNTVLTGGTILHVWEMVMIEAIAPKHATAVVTMAAPIPPNHGINIR